MTWEEASVKIHRIAVPMHLNRESRYRIVEAIKPDCKTYEYNSEPGFVVRIGLKQTIEIPFSMLEQLFISSTIRGVYNNGIFKKHYEQQLKNHGCHVHVVGKIFELVGACRKKDNNYYLL